MAAPSASVSAFSIDAVQSSRIHLLMTWLRSSNHQAQEHLLVLSWCQMKRCSLALIKRILLVPPCLSWFSDRNPSPWSNWSHSWCSELLFPLCSFASRYLLYRGCVSLLSLILPSRPRRKPILCFDYPWSSGLSNTKFSKHLLSLILCHVRYHVLGFPYIYALSNFKARLIYLRGLAQFFMYNNKIVVDDERVWKYHQS